MGSSSGTFPHRLYTCQKLREPDRPSLIRPRTARADLDGMANGARFNDRIFRVRTAPAAVEQTSS
jgi:hypothetical protein